MSIGQSFIRLFEMLLGLPARERGVVVRNPSHTLRR